MACVTTTFRKPLIILVNVGLHGITHSSCNSSVGTIRTNEVQPTAKVIGRSGIPTSIRYFKCLIHLVISNTAILALKRGSIL